MVATAVWVAMVATWEVEVASAERGVERVAAPRVAQVGLEEVAVAWEDSESLPAARLAVEKTAEPTEPMEAVVARARPAECSLARPREQLRSHSRCWRQQAGARSSREYQRGHPLAQPPSVLAVQVHW